MTRFEVNPAPLPEAPAVVALRLGLHDRPLCFTLTADEPGWVAEKVAARGWR